jgi:hypothetical protein
LFIHVSEGRGIRNGSGGARVDPQPKLWPTNIELRAILKMKAKILGKQEREQSEIRLVGEWTSPEHVEEARVLGITWSRETGVWNVLQSRTEGKKRFPFCTTLSG